MSPFGPFDGSPNERPIGQPGAQNPAVVQSGFMSKVYLWMTFGLFTTGFTSYMTAHSETLLQAIFGNMAIFWGLIILQLVMVLGMSALMNRINAFMATVIFFVYALLNGLTFSVIFLAYTQQSIAAAFTVTGGMFAGLSLYGMITKRDLSALGTFMFSALLGLILAMVVNMFLHNSILDLFVSVAAVIIFSGLTAYDTQKLRQLSFGDSEAMGKGAIYGALMLYLDFVNLFLNILRLMGGSSRR